MQKSQQVQRKSWQVCIDIATISVMTGTPKQAGRIDDDLWAAAKAEAERRGETITAVITRCLKRYTRP